MDVSALQALSTPQVRAGLYRQFLSAFEAEQAGIRVRLAGFLGTDAMVAAIIAGSAPDVFPSPAPAYSQFFQKGLLLPLDAYLRRDQVDMGIWSPTLVSAFQTRQGTFALSRDINPWIYAIRLDILDQLGMNYPSADWTHTEFAQLAGSLSVSGQRVGVVFQPGALDFVGILHGFGGAWTNGARTSQTLATAAGIQAGRWLFEDLVWPGFAAIGGDSHIRTNTAAMEEIQANSLLSLYQQLGDRVKWTLYPPPVYPRRRSGNVGAAFWAISAGTAQPEASWTLLQWLAIQPAFQRMMMKAFLFPPALTALIAEWIADIQVVAPGLTGKGLRWVQQSASQGWGAPQPYFAYDTPQAFAVDAKLWQALQQRRTSVQTGFTQADQQVDAIEQAGARAPAVTLRSLRAARARSSVASASISGHSASGSGQSSAAAG